jgi:hypothetical protein
VSDPTPATVSHARASLVRTIVAAIMFLTGAYVGVDWCQFFFHFASSFPAGAGYARTVLCFVLVVLIGPTAVSLTDRRWLGAAFVVTSIADYFVILADEMALGTLTFMVVHGIFIVRHARGLRASFAPEERGRTIRCMAITGVVAFGGAGAVLLGTASILRGGGVLAIDCVYVLVLAVSLWMAWGTLIRRYYPRYNAWLIAIGMTSFFFCDVSVGLAAALAGHPSGSILGNLVGMFYTPALVLLAFSGFRWFREPRGVE